MTVFLVFVVASVAGAVGGYLFGRLARPAPGPAPSPEADLLRRQAAEMAREVQALKEEIAAGSAFAAQIPFIVKKLAEAQSAAGLPAVLVRITKELFQPASVGFFAPAGTGDNCLLVEGAGFPPDWKWNRNFSATAGMLGAALMRGVIVMKEDFAGRAGNQPPSPGSLEAAGVGIDVVAPVVAAGRTYGALVLAGMPPQTGKERLYASMLSDLALTAFQNATTVESADLHASTDHLTRLFNRAYLAPRFEAELRRAKSYSLPVSFFLFDIDRFKAVNDRYGHPAGDVVLKGLAETARKTTRSSDILVRYGGEEFAILMTTATKEQALVHAERLRETIEEKEFPVAGLDAPLRITISGGVATFPEDGETTVDLIRAADQALYDAKSQGRNRVLKASRTGLDGKPY